MVGNAAAVSLVHLSPSLYYFRPLICDFLCLLLLLQHYHHAFETARCQLSDSTAAGFELNFSRCIRTYLKMKNNPHQMCWSWTKVGLM